MANLNCDQRDTVCKACTLVLEAQCAQAISLFPHIRGENNMCACNSCALQLPKAESLRIRELENSSARTFESNKGVFF